LSSPPRWALLYSLAGSRCTRWPVAGLSRHPAHQPARSPVDRAFYSAGETEINNKFAPGFLVGVNDAQDASGTSQVTARGS
jgi:hypothetical protein